MLGCCGGDAASVQVPALEMPADDADHVRAEDVLFAFGVIADVQYADRFSALAPARDLARRGSLCVARSLALRKRKNARERAQVHSLGENVNERSRSATETIINY